MNKFLFLVEKQGQMYSFFAYKINRINMKKENAVQSKSIKF